MADNELWKQLTGLPTLPLLGVSVHKSWLAKDPAHAQALYTAYKQAADWAIANPPGAAKLIAEATKLEGAQIDDRHAELPAGELCSQRTRRRGRASQKQSEPIAQKATAMRKATR